MDPAIIPLPNRRRLNAKDRALRRKHIFARLRDGWAYDEIAREERLTTERVREIVDEVLQKRRADASPALVGIGRKSLENLISRGKNRVKIVSGTRPHPSAARLGCVFVLHHV
jgi:hypothetical protein